MKPTPEQLEVIARAFSPTRGCECGGLFTCPACLARALPIWKHVRAQALEEADDVASECNAESCRCGEGIRALKDKP